MMVHSLAGFPRHPEGTSDCTRRRTQRHLDAPDAETAMRVHREAHGLLADEIYEVSEGS